MEGENDEIHGYGHQHNKNDNNFGLQPLDNDLEKIEICSVGGLSENLFGKITKGRGYTNSFDKGFENILRPGGLKSLDESFEDIEENNIFRSSHFNHDKSPSVSPTYQNPQKMMGHQFGMTNTSRSQNNQNHNQYSKTIKNSNQLTEFTEQQIQQMSLLNKLQNKNSEMQASEKSKMVNQHRQKHSSRHQVSQSAQPYDKNDPKHYKYQKQNDLKQSGYKDDRTSKHLLEQQPITQEQIQQMQDQQQVNRLKQNRSKNRTGHAAATAQPAQNANVAQPYSGVTQQRPDNQYPQQYHMAQNQLHGQHLQMMQQMQAAQGGGGNHLQQIQQISQAQGQQLVNYAQYNHAQQLQIAALQQHQIIQLQNQQRRMMVPDNTMSSQQQQQYLGVNQRMNSSNMPMLNYSINDTQLGRTIEADARRFSNLEHEQYSTHMNSVMPPELQQLMQPQLEKVNNYKDPNNFSSSQRLNESKQGNKRLVSIDFRQQDAPTKVAAPQQQQSERQMFITRPVINLRKKSNQVIALPSKQQQNTLIQKNFSNQADSRISSNQNPYDDSQSANSNRARLGNKGKAEITLDNSSKINNGGKPETTVQIGSVRSSKFRDNQSKDILMVSIKLNNCKNDKSSNNNTQTLNRQDLQADSLFNQSLNGKSKVGLVAIPNAISNGNNEISKELETKRQKVIISLKNNQSPKTIIPVKQVELPRMQQNSSMKEQQKRSMTIQVKRDSQVLHQPLLDQKNIDLVLNNYQGKLMNNSNIQSQNSLPKQNQHSLPTTQLPKQMKNSYKEMEKSQGLLNWQKQQYEQNIKYQNILGSNNNYAQNYQLDQNKQQEFFDKPNQRRNPRFKSSQIQGDQIDNSQYAFQQRQSSDYPTQQQNKGQAGHDQFQMINDGFRNINMNLNQNVPGTQRTNETGNQEAMNEDYVNLFRNLANAAAQAGQQISQRQQLNFIPNQKDDGAGTDQPANFGNMFRTQTMAQPNETSNRSRPGAKLPQTNKQVNSESITAQEGSTPAHQISSNDVEVQNGGKYNAGTHNNISIGNFIKQDLIVNFHMNNMGMKSPPDINQVNVTQPKKEETLNFSQPNSGQAEIGRINSRQAESGSSHQQNEYQLDSPGHIDSGAHSIFAVAGEQFEMTMSMGSSKHEKINPNIRLPEIPKEIQKEEKIMVNDKVKSTPSSTPASSMWAALGSSNLHSHQTEVAPALIKTVNQLILYKENKYEASIHSQSPFAPFIQNGENQQSFDMQQLEFKDEYFQSKVQNIIQQLEKCEGIDHRHLIGIDEVPKVDPIFADLNQPDAEEIKMQEQNEQKEQNEQIFKIEAVVAALESDHQMSQFLEQAADQPIDAIESLPNNLILEERGETTTKRGRGRGRGRGEGRKRGRGSRGGRGGITADRGGEPGSPSIVRGRGRGRGRGKKNIIGETSPVVNEIVQIVQQVKNEESDHADNQNQLMKFDEINNKSIEQDVNLNQIKIIKKQSKTQKTPKSDHQISQQNIVEGPNNKKPQSVTEFDHFVYKIDTNNTEMKRGLFNISDICDNNVLEQINNVNDDGQQIQDDDSIEKQAPLNVEKQAPPDVKQPLEDQVQHLFHNFQQNLSQIQMLHQQINSALDQEQFQDAKNSIAQPGEYPQGHETLRFLQSQIKNIQKIARETQKFHEFFLNENKNDLDMKNENTQVQEQLPINSGNLLFDEINDSFIESHKDNLKQLKQKEQNLKMQKKIIEEKLENIKEKPLDDEEDNILVMIDEDGEEKRSEVIGKQKPVGYHKRKANLYKQTSLIKNREIEENDDQNSNMAVIGEMIPFFPSKGIQNFDSDDSMKQVIFDLSPNSQNRQKIELNYKNALDDKINKSKSSHSHDLSSISSKLKKQSIKSNKKIIFQTATHSIHHDMFKDSDNIMFQSLKIDKKQSVMHSMPQNEFKGPENHSPKKAKPIFICTRKFNKKSPFKELNESPLKKRKQQMDEDTHQLEEESPMLKPYLQKSKSKKSTFSPNKDEIERENKRESKIEEKQVEKSDKIKKARISLIIPPEDKIESVQFQGLFDKIKLRQSGILSFNFNEESQQIRMVPNDVSFISTQKEKLEEKIELPLESSVIGQKVDESIVLQKGVKRTPRGRKCKQPADIEDKKEKLETPNKKEKPEKSEKLEKNVEKPEKPEKPKKIDRRYGPRKPKIQREAAQKAEQQENQQIQQQNEEFPTPLKNALKRKEPIILIQQSDDDYIPKKRNLKQTEKIDIKLAEVQIKFSNILPECEMDNNIQLGKRSRKHSNISDKEQLKTSSKQAKNQLADPLQVKSNGQSRNNLRATAQRHLHHTGYGTKEASAVENLNDQFQSGGLQSQYNLLQCEQYQSFENQPYRIFFTFEVQMLMFIHSYLSKNEVIGLLGGKCYESAFYMKGSLEPIKYLIVSKIYPSESCIKQPSVRLKNCEISDDQQIKIQELMDKDGVVKLAWYHSHPIFEVDPSVLDLQTHQRQQSCFDMQGLPFFGVIIGPYHQKQDISETLFKVFHLKEDRNQNKQRTAKLNFKDRGRALYHKIIPNTKLKYSMYQGIKQMIRQGSTHKWDRPDLAAEWGKRSLQGRFTNQEKFMRSLEKICDDNLKLQSDFDMDNEIRNHLNPQDRLNFEEQLFKIQDSPLQIMLQQPDGTQATAPADTESNQPRPKPSLPGEISPQQQNLQSRIFFSISESKKISKYLFKIEQCLIKNFGVKTQNLMELTYEAHKQKDQEENVKSNDLQE